MSTTTKRGLNKPARTDYVNVVTAINNNMDNLDDAVPDSRTVNSKALSANITLDRTDFPTVDADLTEVKSIVEDVDVSAFNVLTVFADVEDTSKWDLNKKLSQSTGEPTTESGYARMKNVLYFSRPILFSMQNADYTIIVWAYKSNMVTGEYAPYKNYLNRQILLPWKYGSGANYFKVAIKKVDGTAMTSQNLTTALSYLRTYVSTDSSLTKTGAAADSKATGDTINAVSNTIALKADKSNTVLLTSLSHDRVGDNANGSIAFGDDVEASGANSVAVGMVTKASADQAFAKGVYTEATGESSSAEGSYSKATGNVSHSEGISTTASGLGSHTEGQSTVANHKSQHVFGEYNVEDDSSAEATEKGNYVEIVGNGTASDAKSNARVLDWDGNERLKGDLYVRASANGTGGKVVAMLEKIAPDYADVDFPVKRGQCCTHNGVLYIANSDVTEEAWTEGHWEPVTVEEKLNAISDTMDAAYVSNITATSSNGVTRQSVEGNLVLYGTATAARRLCFLNGQNAVKISTSPFDKTLDAGTYIIESDMTGYQSSYTIDATYTSFASGSLFSIVQSTKKTAIITFTAPVMIGLRVIDERNYGTSDNPSTLSFKATRIIADDVVARDFAHNVSDSLDLTNDSLNGVEALLGNVEYAGTPNKYTNSTPSKINLWQNGNIVLLNNTEATAETSSSTIRFYRLNDGVSFQSSSNWNDDTLHTALKEGHTYRLFVKKLSGSVSSFNGGTIRLFVVDSNTAGTGTDSPAFVNLLELAGATAIDFVAGADYSINIVIRVINGILCTNLKLAVYLLDITESVLGQATAQTRRAVVLDDEPIEEQR